MNHFIDYIREREGREVYQTLEGFITYEMIDENTVYLVDIYVATQFRNKNIATQLADYVVELTNAKVVMGSIDPNIPSAHTSLLVLLAYGMKLDRYENGLLLFKKIKDVD